MIEPLKPCKNGLFNFVVVDIENEVYPDEPNHPDNGRVIDVGASYRDYRNAFGEMLNEPEPGKSFRDYPIVHHVFPDWISFWEWLLPLAMRLKRFRQLFAHNGGGWDYHSFVIELLEKRRDEFKTISGVFAGGKTIVVNIWVEERVNISLCDSLQLLKSSLDRLSKLFLKKGKVDLDGKLPHQIKAENPELYYSYLRDDCGDLVQILEVALELIREKIAPIDTFAMTIGSTAMKIWRTMGLHEKVSIPANGNVFFDEDDEQYELRSFLRDGYRGGRVQSFELGEFPGTRVYDINSLYPSVMRELSVPISERGVWVNEYVEGNPGCYRLSFNQKRRDIKPIFCIGGEGRYEGEGVFFSPEIDLFNELKAGELTIKTGFAFLEHDVLFREYVDKLYELRMENKGTALDEMVKYCLNSLYGKFGQHSLKDEWVFAEDFDSLLELTGEAMRLEELGLDSASGVELEPGAILTMAIDEYRGLWSVTKNTLCRHEHVGIAGMITSAARVKLFRGIMAAERMGGLVLYCDTDSVHVVGELSIELVGKELGKFKLEFPDESAKLEYGYSGVYAGKKLYSLRQWKPLKDCPDIVYSSDKVRAKGISVGGRNGARLTYDMLCSLVRGEVETIACTYKTPDTAKQVWKGSKPHVFRERTRRIRVLNGKG